MVAQTIQDANLPCLMRKDRLFVEKAYNSDNVD